MELIVVRHALPVRIENSEGTPADPQLDALGIRQADAVAAWLSDRAEGPIDALWSSPMRRAIQTAAPIAAALALTPIVDPDLAEYDRHHHEYIPVEELRAAKDERWDAIVRGEWEGASPAEFREQVVRVMERIIAGHRGQRVVVVCHGGVINAYATAVMSMAPSPGFFYPQYTCINRFLAASTGERMVQGLNEVAHLRGRNLLP